VQRCDFAQQVILPVPRLSWQSRMNRRTFRRRWSTIGQWDDNCVIEPTSYTAACADKHLSQAACLRERGLAS
jgi:hypothetical protein